MCEHPGCNVTKPIARITGKHRGSDFLAVLRDDNTLTVYKGAANDGDHVLIAYGEIDAAHDVAECFPLVDLSQVARVTE